MADPPWIVMDSHETWVTDERQDSSSIVTEGSTTDCWCGAQPPIHHAIAPTGAFGGPRDSRDGDPLSVSEHNCISKKASFPINGGYYCYDSITIV